MPDDESHSSLDVVNFSFTYPNSSRHALKDISFQLRQGQLLYVLGGPQSGKTTLAMALAGLIPNLIDGTCKGEIFVCGENTRSKPAHDLASKVGIVLQDPDSQLIEMRVDDEIALALENRGIPQQEIRSQVWHAMEQLRITSLAQRDPGQLSGGEKQRVVIAATLVLEPQILIFDEPLSDLDNEGARLFWSELMALQTRLGLSIVVMDKRVPDGPIQDCEVLVLRQGTIVRRAMMSSLWKDVGFWRANHIIAPPLAEALAALRMPVGLPGPMDDLLEKIAHSRSWTLTGSTEEAERSTGPFCGPDTIVFTNVCFSYDSDPLLEKVTFSVVAGEILGIVGHNGSGKTTILRLIAGLANATSGSIRVLDKEPAGREGGYLGTKVGIFFQNPVYQLVFDTLAGDLEFSTRALPPEQLKNAMRQIQSMAEGFGVAHKLDSSPEELSYGEKHCAALAAVLSNCQLEILLLDEPTRALHPEARDLLKRILVSLRARGVSIVITSHDTDFIYEIADRVMAMRAGQIESIGKPSEILGNPRIRENCHFSKAVMVELAKALKVPLPRSPRQLLNVVEQQNV